MFVLTTTHKIVSQSDDPIIGILLAVGLILILVIAGILFYMDYKEQKNEESPDYHPDD